MVRVEVQVFGELAQGLGGSSLRDGTSSERVQCDGVSAFLELNNGIPLEVLSRFVHVDKFLCLLFLAVAGLDEVAQLKVVKVELDANYSLGSRMESLSERYRVIPLSSHTELYQHTKLLDLGFLQIP